MEKEKKRKGKQKKRSIRKQRGTKRKTKIKKRIGGTPINENEDVILNSNEVINLDDQ